MISTPRFVGEHHEHDFEEDLRRHPWRPRFGRDLASQSSYAAPAYGYGCELRQRPIYNAWGDVVGYRRPVRVCY